MAPEVVLGLPYYEKADIFSLGCCMYEVGAPQTLHASAPCALSLLCP